MPVLQLFPSGQLLRLSIGEVSPAREGSPPPHQLFRQKVSALGCWERCCLGRKRETALTVKSDMQKLKYLPSFLFLPGLFCDFISVTFQHQILAFWGDMGAQNGKGWTTEEVCTYL